MFNRKEKITNIRQKLRQNIPSIGSWMQLGNASVAEIMGAAGYDWVAVDLEHGAIAIHQLPDLFRALELGGTLPLSRIAEGTSHHCKQALDAGAAGVIVPMVQTASQLMSICEICCWPPKGKRGVGFSRANLFGKHFDAYVEEAQVPLIIAMIEHIQAVDNLPEILQVEGVDAILIGPYDLSASMKITAQFNHPEFKSTIDYIKQCAMSVNKACGIHVVEPVPAQLNRFIIEGYRFLPYSIDAVFLNSTARKPEIKIIDELVKEEISNCVGDLA